MDRKTVLQKIIDLAEDALDESDEEDYSDLDEEFLQSEIDARAGLTNLMKDIVDRKKIVAKLTWYPTVSFVRYWGHRTIHIIKRGERR